MLGWAVVLVLLVVVAVVASGASPRTGGSSARARLDERLAAGDLTVEEHAERVALLDEHAGRRDVPWVVIVVGALVLLVVGIVGWAAGGTSMGWWGDHDRVMGEHMGRSWSSSADADRPVAGAREVEVTATDLAFDPGVIDIRAGEPVNITLVNEGAVFHDLWIPDLGFMLDANPGQRVSGSLTVDEPGSYEFSCSVPGHADAGMRGTLEVRGGSR